MQTQNLVDVTLAGNSTSAGAGYILISSGTMTLAGGNNITLSQNGNHVTILGAAGGTGAGIFGIAGSNASTATSGTVQFANSNNLTFGLAGNTITASASFAQSAQTGISGIAGSGTATATSGTVVFANSNGLTFGLNGNTITGSYTVPVTNSFTAGVGTGALGTTGTVSNGIFFSGGTNITLSQSSGAGGATITFIGPAPGTTQSAQTGISGIQGSGTNIATSGTVQFQNSNGLTFGLSGNTITASASFSQSVQAAQTGISGIAGSGASTAISGTVQFQNSNGLTFGLSGNTITGSYTVPAAQTGISGIAGSNASTAVSGTVVFANSNGLTFGLSGNTITGSYSIYNFADQEIPTGALNGTNTTYNLAHAPNPAACLQLVLNGQILVSSFDYTLNSVSLTAASVFSSADRLRAWYRY